jgi:hypothetical protein
MAFSCQKSKKGKVVKWLVHLYQLSEYPPELFRQLARLPEIEYVLSSWFVKGGVQLRTDGSGEVIGFTVHINPSQTSSEQEVTLVHELFHLELGRFHPQQHRMMFCLDNMMYRFVEHKIDEAAYAFCNLHPLFIQDLFRQVMTASAQKNNRKNISPAS